MGVSSTIPGAEAIRGDDTNVSISTGAGGAALPNAPKGCSSFALSVETFPVRMRGTAQGNPSSTLGLYIPIGGPYDITFDPTSVKFIGIGGTAILNVIYKS